MEKHGRFLSQEQATAMQEDGFTFLAAYAACHKWAQEHSLVHFTMKPKYHAFIHMVYDLEQNLENPKHFHCFQDEGYMGVIARISKGCHRRVYPIRGMQRFWNCILLEISE